MKFFVAILVIIAVISAIAIPISGNDNPSVDTSKQEVSVEVDFSDKTYIAFGDSITYGQDMSYGFRMPNPYPESVGALLSLKSVSNQGVCASTLVDNVPYNDCITSIIEALTQSYDIISVMGGVNDYGCSTPLGDKGDTTKNSVYGALDTIARTLKMRFPNAFIFFMTPYKSNYMDTYCTVTNSQGYNLSDVAEAVRYIANKYGLPVLDMYSNGNFEVFGMSMEGCDGLHPPQNFVTNYTAPQIAKFIRDNYNK